MCKWTQCPQIYNLPLLLKTCSRYVTDHFHCVVYECVRRYDILFCLAHVHFVQRLCVLIKVFCFLSAVQFQVRGQQCGRENDIERFNKLQRESTFHKLDRTSHLDIFAKPSPEPLTTVDTSTNNTTYIPTITSTPAVTTTTPVVEDKYAISMSYQNSIEEQETTAYFSPPEVIVCLLLSLPC